MRTPTRTSPPAPDPVRPPFAAGATLAIAGLLAIVLSAVAGRYGYHRDELYFLAAARHPDWGYPDQPPLTPLIAGLVQAIAPGSIVALRVVPIVAAVLVVVVAALLARELGGGRAAQALTASCCAVAVSTVVVFHLFSTTAFDVLAWTVVTWLVARQLRGADPRGWLLVGVALGVGLQNKTLIALLAAALVAGVLIAGPRRLFGSGWFWAGAAVALAIWAPNLVWQGLHGWPQLALSRSIAAGGSTSSQPWYLFLPYQLILYSPLYAPIWITGLVVLLRSPRLRSVRSFGWAYLLLVVVFQLTGGKPYYLAGMYPVLLAAGAQPVVDWVAARATILRPSLVVTAVVGTAAAAAVLGLPLPSVTDLDSSPALVVNPDLGETVGWPGFVDQVAAVVEDAPRGSIILTRNYGEAGAIDRYGADLGLTPAFSGHNGYGLWGPPDDSVASAVVVGYDRADVDRWFAECREAGEIETGVDNEEDGAPLWICESPRAPWSELWPGIRRLG